jgi:hypothetical protein
MATPRPGSRGNGQFAELPSRAGGYSASASLRFHGVRCKRADEDTLEQQARADSACVGSSRLGDAVLYEVSYGLQERAVACFM